MIKTLSSGEIDLGDGRAVSFVGGPPRRQVVAAIGNAESGAIRAKADLARLQVSGDLAALVRAAIEHFRAAQDACQRASEEAESSL